MSAATKGTGSVAACAYRKQENEPERAACAASLTGNGNQLDERCQPGWEELCGKAKSALLRWMPSGLATRPLSLAYSSKPVHNHPQEPWPERSAPSPRQDGPSHGRSPTHTRPRTPRNHHRDDHAQPGTHRRAEKELDVKVGLKIGCRAVEVGLKLRSRPAVVEGR